MYYKMFKSDNDYWLLCPKQTSYTLTWCLYNLAINPSAQETLRQEISSVVGKDEMITPLHINAMPYLRGCIKETLRCAPKRVG